MLAEAEGVDALWYPDHLMAWHPRALWREAGGVLAEVVPDPHAYADPFVAATTRCLAPAGPGWASRSPTPTAATRRPSPRPRPRSASSRPAASSSGSDRARGSTPSRSASSAPVRSRRLGEALEVVTRLLATDGPVSFQGEHFTLDRLPGMGVAGEPPPVEIVLGGHSDALLRLVGRFGTGWLPVLPTTAEHYAEQLQIAQQRRGATGTTRTPSSPASTSTRSCTRTVTSR